MEGTVTQLRPGELPIELARRLETEAATAVDALIQSLRVDLGLIVIRCTEAATLTSAPPGVTEELRRLAEDTQKRLDTIDAIRSRQ
jgi:hypothetical protein